MNNPPVAGSPGTQSPVYTGINHDGKEEKGVSTDVCTQKQERLPARNRAEYERLTRELRRAVATVREAEATGSADRVRDALADVSATARKRAALWG